MTYYRYHAVRQDGRVVRGGLDAGSPEAAVAEVVAKGWTPVEISPSAYSAWGRPVPVAQWAVAFQSLAAMVDAGMPLERALGASAAIARPPLRATLVSARKGLRQGRTLAKALESEGLRVPPLVSAVLTAGERGGHLTNALARVAEYLQHQSEVLGRIRHALAYPVLLTLAGTASVALIVTRVLPRFSVILRDLGGTLPPSTSAVLGIAALTTRYWPLCLVLVVLAALGTTALWRHPKGRAWVERSLLAVPLVGPLRFGFAAARTTGALAACLHSGMPLLGALEIGAQASANPLLTERIRRARHAVARGLPLAEALRLEGALPASNLELVSIGEGSGQLAVMMERASALASAQAERSLRTAVGLLEPGLIVLFGAIVTLVAAALLQAVYAIRPGGAM